jgi:ATP sulfurylase
MTLTDGTLWPIPIVFDIAEEEIKKKKVKEGNDKFYAGTPQL